MKNQKLSEYIQTPDTASLEKEVKALRGRKQGRGDAGAEAPKRTLSSQRSESFLSEAPSGKQQLSEYIQTPDTAKFGKRSKSLGGQEAGQGRYWCRSAQKIVITPKKQGAFLVKC